MKKILWVIIFIVLLYIVLIFFKPLIAEQIAKQIWIEKFNEFIINSKDKLDYVSTKIPTKDDLEKAYSWAQDTISDIKENIEDIRWTANDIEEKYNDAKDFINETWEKIENAKEALNDLKKVWDSITNLVNTWSVK